MVGKGLTESDVLEIVYKSDESFSDSNNDSISNTIMKVMMQLYKMQLYKMTVMVKKKYCINNSYGRSRITIHGTEKCLVVILDPDLVQKM